MRDPSFMMLRVREIWNSVKELSGKCQGILFPLECGNPDLWPQYECKSLWPIFHGPVILLYIWKPIWHMNIILPDYEMVSHNYSPQYDCKSLWPIFHGPVILLYISKIIWHMHIIFTIMKWYDTTFDLNMIVSHCDLYFMVQWFCSISLKAHLTYEHHTSRLWNAVTQLFTSIWMQVTVTYISWSSDFALYLEDHLTYAHHIFRLWNGMTQPFDLNMIVSLCDPIFHGPVSLPYIWKPIWHMNIILPDYEMVWHSV